MKNPETPSQQVTPEEFKKRNRRSFIGAGIAAIGGLTGLRWMFTGGEPEGRAPFLFRKAFEWNEKLTRAVYSPERENSTSTPPADGTRPRINGDIGIKDELNLAEWDLTFEAPGQEPRVLKMEELQKLPKTRSQAVFKCIEGWSASITYEGVKFSDFLAHVCPGGSKFGYGGLETPDEDYYVGLDMESLMHPQTILAFSMNGAPLTPKNGAPLRLIVPVKYGIKHLKRVGRIFLAEERPADFWAEQGYDWYSGH